MDCTETNELRLRLEFGDPSGLTAGTQSEIWDLQLRPQFAWGFLGGMHFVPKQKT